MWKFGLKDLGAESSGPANQYPLSDVIEEEPDHYHPKRKSVSDPVDGSAVSRSSDPEPEPETDTEPQNIDLDSLKLDFEGDDGESYPVNPATTAYPANPGMRKMKIALGLRKKPIF
jgi:hypothetical protein